MSPWVSEAFPEGFGQGEIQIEHAGKLQFLANLLEHIRARRERIVIVSNYTEVTIGVDGIYMLDFGSIITTLRRTRVPFFPVGWTNSS